MEWVTILIWYRNGLEHRENKGKKCGCEESRLRDFSRDCNNFLSYCVALENKPNLFDLNHHLPNLALPSCYSCIYRSHTFNILQLERLPNNRSQFPFLSPSNYLLFFSDDSFIQWEVADIYRPSQGP